MQRTVDVVGGVPELVREMHGYGLDATIFLQPPREEKVPVEELRHREQPHLLSCKGHADNKGNCEDASGAAPAVRAVRTIKVVMWTLRATTGRGEAHHDLPVPQPVHGPCGR
eukprot:1196390-Prorocentrum_minimum.AAC.5